MQNQRVRKVDLKKQPLEQVDNIGESIGRKLSQISDEACSKMNQVTEIYGVKVIISIQFVDQKTGKLVS